MRLQTKRIFTAVCTGLLRKLNDGIILCDFCCGVEQSGSSSGSGEGRKFESCPRYHTTQGFKPTSEVAPDCQAFERCCISKADAGLTRIGFFVPEPGGFHSIRQFPFCL